MDEVEKLLQADESDEFISFIEWLMEEEELDNTKIKINPHELLLKICDHNAVNCAVALLEGETGLKVDLNEAFESGLYPLHYVAQKAKPILVEVFLGHGARTDLLCEVNESKYYGKLPLDGAIEAVPRHDHLRYWSIAKSFYKLFYILCSCGLADHLDRVKLLALSTEEDAVHRLSLRLAQEGRLVELATLLLVAHEKFTTPMIAQNIQTSILRQLQLLMNEEFKLLDHSAKSKDLLFCQHKKAVMVCAFQIFKFLESAGEFIERYRSERSKKVEGYIAAKELVYVLKELGFTFAKDETDIEDISCLTVGLKQEESEGLRTAIQNQLFSKSCMSNPGPKRLELPCTGMSFSIVRRQFHSCPILKDRLVKTCAPIRLQMNRKFLWPTEWASFVFRAKKIVRYI